MATEKILNTRLQLKYDTLANWNSSTFIPKKGEACIVEVPTGTSVTGVVNPPAIMIKVGNGTDKFSVLPWTAATAADVYTWAKKNQLPVEVVDNGTGTFVTDVVGAWDAINNKYTLTLSRSNVGMTITEETGTNDGKYVTGLVWDKTTETLKPQMVAFDTTMSTTSTNAVQNKVVKAAIDAAEKAAKDYSDSNEKTSSVSNTDKVIKVTSTTTGNNTDYNLDFQYDNSGNVKFEETANGLKATVSITDVKVDKAVYADEAGKATNDGAGNNIVNTYATKAEITAKEALWTKDTVTKVTDDGKAIEVNSTDTMLEGSDITYTVKLKINEGTPGNVTLSQTSNGLKANTTPAAIGAQPAGNYKTTQTTVTDKITDKAHVLDSLTQNENGVISYTVKTLTPDDIGAKSKQTAVSKTLTGAQVVGTISQNENGVITVTDRTITAADLGLDKAISFLGTSTTVITDGGSEKPTISETEITPVPGNVVLYGNQEYIYNTTGKWELFGDEGSYALKTTGITANNGLTSTAKLDGTGSIGIADSGVTTAKINAKAVTTAKIDDSAVTATQLASDAVITAKIKDANVTKAKLEASVQTSLGKADTAVQEITWTTGTVSPNGNQGATYILSVDGQMTGSALTTPEYVEEAIELVTGEIGEKTVKKYVDDAVAGVIAGEVKNAEYATSAGSATKATQDASGNVITSTYETKTDAAQKLTDAKAYTDAEIKKLDVSDTAVAGQYVSAVSETDGKISVSRTALPVYSVTVADGTVVTDTVITGASAATEYTKDIKVNGTTVGTFLTPKGVADYISDAIGGLDSAAGYDSGATSDGSHAPALTSFTIENGKVSSYKTNENLTGYIEDLDQREGTILVFDCGSATKNI